MSHPLGVRELKRCIQKRPYALQKSHPLGVRELKHQNQETVNQQGGVAPFRGA
ncbi:Uncharacterised protein [Porphyromonas endodontalis]|nr:Uncharacterised protein [Porphyromonas endodontalis]